MAKVRHKKTKKADTSEDVREHRIPSSISPETQKGVVIVLLFALAGVSLLSFFSGAGPFGQTLDHYLAIILGVCRFAIPLIAVILGYVLIYPDKYNMRWWHYAGLVLLILSGSAFLHLFWGSSLIQEAQLGHGGGFVGVVLSLPLMKAFGIWAAGMILFALMCIAVLVVFNTSIEHILQRLPASSLLGRMRERLQQRWMAWRHKRQQAGFEDDEDMDAEPTEEGMPELSEEDIAFAKRELAEFNGQATPAEPKQLELVLPKPKRYRKVDLPMELLNLPSETPVSGDIDVNKEKIHKTLENFGIEVEMGDVSVGPTVTQYTLRPTEGVKLSQITTLQNDIALALAVHPIRIEAPIPGKSLVGIEIPNHSAATVTLREILDSKQFRKRKDNLTLPFGKDVAGEPYFYSLQKMPHMLIAGATGSGKSVCINIILVSLIAQNSPEDLKFILVDPKRVELTSYNKIPYLLTPVITEVDKTVNALRWCVAEMDRRYQVLSEAGVRNIESFNKDSDSDSRMPYIVLVIDELADLMAVAANEVEAAIVRLAQMSRAVGIHLVLATQRPSVNVITGLIKANMPARAAFAVTSQVDSRTILDISGAEKLLGRGDMLFTTAELSKPKRLQGAFLSDPEIERVCEFVSTQGEPDFDQTVVNKQKSSVMPQAYQDSESEDSLLDEAKQVILQSGKASASLLQRRLRVGYARAARLLDILEEQGYIGPADGAKPREILSTEASALNGGMSLNDEDAEEMGETTPDEETIDDEEEDKDKSVS